MPLSFILMNSASLIVTLNPFIHIVHMKGAWHYTVMQFETEVQRLNSHVLN